MKFTEEQRKLKAERAKASKASHQEHLTLKKADPVKFEVDRVEAMKDRLHSHIERNTKRFEETRDQKFMDRVISHKKTLAAL